MMEFKEDVEIMVDDAAGGLHTREMKKRLGHAHAHGDGGGEEELITATGEEEQNSVFFDPIKVSDHVTEVIQFEAQKEEANGTSGPKGKESETHENVDAQETNHNSNNGKLENGSHSDGSHDIPTAYGKAGLKLIVTIDENKHRLVNSDCALDISNGSMSTTNAHEIEVEKNEHVAKGKVNIVEYDLETILDEQETHDLYCPNCNSCITRRVILRKRKRTLRQTARDEPPKEPQLAEPSANEPPDIFRCLSCFAFFSPTGCGFNIFRIFGRTEANQELQVQHPPASHDMSDSCGSWILSCFQSGDSPKNADADSARKPLTGITQSSIDTTISAEASTSTGKPERSKNPLPAESSSHLQTTATKNEDEIEPSFDGIHGIAVPDSSTSAIRIRYRNSKTEGTIPIGVPGDLPHLVLPIHDPGSDQRDEWDILKAIVYGGLAETIASLSVVSAAASSGAKTLDIFILAIANLIGGLPLIFHNMADLRNLGDVDENNEQVGHYWLQLGRRSKFRLHMVMAILSYILFGLLPPVVYGLAFHKSDNRENKMMVVAAASLAGIALLAIGKAHVQRPRSYIKTLIYYLTIGVSGSGLSYVAGVLITRLLAHFGLTDQAASAPTSATPGLLFPDAVRASTVAWASY